MIPAEDAKLRPDYAERNLGQKGAGLESEVYRKRKLPEIYKPSANPDCAKLLGLFFPTVIFDS